MTASVMVQEVVGIGRGEWHVHTRDSIQIFELDAWTVERQPGRSAQADLSGAPPRLRTIERCRVGERGHWTMKSGDHLIDYYFHDTSVIERIDRVDAEERGKEPGQDLNRLDQL